MITIIGKCDLCNRNTTDLNSIILYKKHFDYCQKCEKKAEEIKNKFKDDIQEEYLWFERNLERIEKNFYKKIIDQK